MYSQFFGNFLLNSKLIKPAQLTKALEVKKNTRLKLGVLAINAGYMTSKQVEEVHFAQTRMDKRFGDIAVDLGFLSHNQVNSLLNSQQTGYLLLGQALVDEGFLSNAQFEKAINDYRAKYNISANELKNEQNDKIEAIISEFYHFDTAENAANLTNYVTLLFKNIIRFIGDDFTPLEATVIYNFKCGELVSQNIKGKYSSFTAIEADTFPFIQFASRFAKEELLKLDEFSAASVGEFLNLHNGLFAVNMSNENDLELELTPQMTQRNTTLTLPTSAFCIPINFTFGTINFILSSSN